MRLSLLDRPVAQSSDSPRMGTADRLNATGRGIIVSGVSEPALFDDEASLADLKAKVSEAWRVFARRLGQALAGLPDEVTLDITLDPTASGTGDAVYAVQIHKADESLTGMAVGNADLPPEFRLDRAAIAGLVALGWAPPGVIPESGESFGTSMLVDDAPRVAALVSRTLRDVYGAPHPAFLTYTAHGTDWSSPVEVPPLGFARLVTVTGSISKLDGEISSGPVKGVVEAVERRDGLALADRVITVVSRLLKIQPDALTIDPDGDIGIRAGSAMVFVRVRDNPPLIDVFSPVLTDIRPTQQLYAKLSDLTNRMPIGRLYHADDTVWASVPVFGRDFQASHLMLAVQVMTGLADELDDRLAGEFGGRRFFGEPDQPSVPRDVNPDGDPGTGMYL